MVITYRRTDGVLALLAFAAIALAGTVLTIVLVATLLAVALAVRAAALVARVVRPTRSWRHTVPPATPWPLETIDATPVNEVAAVEHPRI